MIPRNVNQARKARPQKAGLGRVDKIRNEQPKAIFGPKFRLRSEAILPNCRAEDMDSGAKSAFGGDMSYIVHVA